MISRFLNLSAGLAWRGVAPEPYGYCRIQSTACEQKRWGAVLSDLDHTMLAALASGADVTVYDCGARKPVSRALWQGLPWIAYALSRRWLGKETRAVVRGGCNATGYFRAVYDDLPDAAFARLDYFRGGLSADAIRLRGKSFALVGHNPSAADLSEQPRAAPFETHSRKGFWP